MTHILRTHETNLTKANKPVEHRLPGNATALFAFCLTFLLLFTGCSAKHPVTPEEFTSIAEEKGFSVQDVTEDTTATYNVESYLLSLIHI